MKKYLQVFIVLISIVGYAQVPQAGWLVLPITETDGDCDQMTGGGGEIFISELYDGLPGGGGEASYAVIELYNPTNTTINLSNYRMRRSGNYGSGNWVNTYQNAWNGAAGTILPGSIAPNSTYLIKIESGNGTSTCSFTPNHTLSDAHGINDNDQIQLLKNGSPIDDVGTPSYPGFTMIRRPNAEVPKDLFNNADWQTVGRSCAGLGSHTIENTTPPEIKFIARQPDPGPLPYTYNRCTQNRVQVRMDASITGYSYSYNLQGTTTPINITNTTGLFSNLQLDTYILTISVRRSTAPTVEICTIEATFIIDGGTETSPIILLNP